MKNYLYLISYSGGDNIFTTENKLPEEPMDGCVGYKLNTDVLDWLTDGSNQAKLKAMILSSNWYQNKFDVSDPYTVSIFQNNNPITAQVGLINIGEILSGQSYSMVTLNGTVIGTYENVLETWLMTSNADSTLGWYISMQGTVGTNLVAFGFALRPVIYVNSSNTISSGNGLLNNPYIIEIK